jgi:AraC-like DNA-binding protein
MRRVELLVDSPEYRPFIRAAGRFRHVPAPPLRSGSHRAQISYVIQCLDAGSGEVVWSGGEVATLDGGGAWLVPPGTAYETRGVGGGDLSYAHFTVDQNPLWRRVQPDYCLGVRTPADRRMIQPPPEAVWGVPLPGVLPAACQDRIVAELPGIIESWLSDDRTRVRRAQDRFALLVGSVVDDVLASGSRNTSLPVEQRVARAEAVAAQTLHLGVDVNQMARAAGYERSYFSGLYQRVRGETARDFLSRLRLQEAKHLLRSTDLKVADVARQLGYRSAFVFIRMFKRHAGQTPGRWRAGPPTASGRGSDGQDRHGGAQ